METPFPNVFFNPLIFCLLQRTLVSFLVGFTPASSSLRLGIFPLLVCCTYLYLPRHCASDTNSDDSVSYAVGFGLTGVLEYIEKVLLSQWSFDEDGPHVDIAQSKSHRGGGESKRPTTKKDLSSGAGDAGKRSQANQGGVWERLKFGIWVALSNRYVGSSSQISKAPSYDARSPSYIPTRATFLWNQVTLFCYCYLFFDLVLQGKDRNPATTYSPEYVPFFSRLDAVTIEELQTRILSVALYWCEVYANIKGLTAALAFMTVASGFDRPELWRPMFGPISEAYTLRGFWGTFWHQNIRNKCTKPARYITFNVLRLPRTRTNSPLPLRLMSRYTELILIFLISGAVHAGIDIAIGIPWEDNGTLKVFLMMAGAIMCEDTIQWAFRTLTGRKEVAAPWAKVVGFVWVILFMSWAVPAWIYPTLRRSPAGGKGLPFSVWSLVFGLLK